MQSEYDLRTCDCSRQGKECMCEKRCELTARQVRSILYALPIHIGVCDHFAPESAKSEACTVVVEHEGHCIRIMPPPGKRINYVGVHDEARWQELISQTETLLGEFSGTVGCSFVLKTKPFGHESGFISLHICKYTLGDSPHAG